MEDPNYRAWRLGGRLARNFGQAVSVCPQFFESQSAQGTQNLTVYYTSDDSTNRLLETSFVPQ
jgi:hypothetical protein